jgi:phosphoglycolate phosphatase
MKRTALVFDLDGTLVDSVPDLQAAINRMLAEIGRRALDAGEIRRMVGDGTAALVARALGATGGAPPDEAALQARFLALYEAEPAVRTLPYEAVAETLQRLKAAGCRLAICTNKPQAAALAVLRGVGLEALFDAVLGGDALPVRKPDPRHLLGAVASLDATPGDAVMIGDNENDHAAAKAAGIPIILMRYGYLRVPPETLAPDAWLDDFAALPEALALIG